MVTRPKKRPKAKRQKAKTHPKAVTTGQLEAILNALNMLIDHADRVASDQIGWLRRVICS
jgi:hypothetical protein